MIHIPRVNVKVGDVWQCYNNTTVSNDELQVYYSSLSNVSKIIKSNELKNGVIISCFKIKITTQNSDNMFLFSIYNNMPTIVYTNYLWKPTSYTTTILIYENDLFLKIAVGNEIKLTLSIVEQPPSRISILGNCSNNRSGSFEIYTHA